MFKWIKCCNDLVARQLHGNSKINIDWKQILVALSHYIIVPLYKVTTTLVWYFQVRFESSSISYTTSLFLFLLAAAVDFFFCFSFRFSSDLLAISAAHVFMCSCCKSLEFVWLAEVSLFKWKKRYKLVLLWKFDFFRDRTCFTKHCIWETHVKLKLMNINFAEEENFKNILFTFWIQIIHEQKT